MKQIISAIAFLLLCTTQNQAAIWYVNLSATGTNSGTSWANACTDIGSALSNSNAGDEIWVAAGTYKPSASNQTVYYDLKADVAIYGGFNGTETVISQRNFTTNATTISGDIGTPGFPNDNTYHLFKATNLNVVATVDGFRIRDGVAYYLGLPHTFGYQGGAAVISNSQVKFANCNFNNSTAQAGGAIYATSSTLTIDKCTFRGNSASFTNGGAIYSQSSNLNITRTNFISNSTTAGAGPADGGGIYIGSGTTPSTINIDRCLFTNNSTTHMGSCIKAFAYNGVIDITNCIMVGNYSKYGSVVELIGTSSPSLPSTAHISSCTMTMNSADTSSLTYHPIQLSATSKKVENSILWNNTSTTQLDTGYIVKNCLVEGGYSTGTNILDLNPNFINPPLFNNLPFIGNLPDYRLNLLSPAINVGDNAFALATLDINDSVRIQNTTVDLGAIENAHCTFPLNLNVTPNDTLCAGQVATITASGGHLFSWSTGSNTNSINVSISGNYSLIAVDTITQCRGNN
ncbi:MAG TPA: choice-of-anchor Q domain-containing protein, partial [Chitinophagaceae bacterium]|nr:choice-of-anchor Q domain-containing protein [Chitinophagaceae bacterium]